MTESPLLTGVEEGVATLTMNRPDALNALNRALRSALTGTLREMNDREDVRVVILTGAGRAFCAGLDVKELAASDRNVTENVEGGDIGGALDAMRKPVIAAVNGLAVTGGFEMALACDMILAADTAWFCDTHARIGLLPGWGLSQRLPRLIGPHRAKEISLTARRVPTAEAAALGFINRAVADAVLMDEAIALARQIAAFPPEVIGEIRSLVNEGYALPLAEALAMEKRVSSAFNSRELRPGKAG